MAAPPAAPDARQPPAAVARRLERLRGTRAFEWLRRHATAAAAVVSALIVLRGWRWVLFVVAAPFEHPGATVEWFERNWPFAVGISVAMFAVVFGSLKLGIDWADRWAQARERLDADDNAALTAVGPAWAERPPDRSTTLPPRMG